MKHFQAPMAKEGLAQSDQAMNLINSFFLSAESDARIGPVHVCLYLSLVNQMNIDQTNPVSIRSRQMMSKARISGIATYHRIIRDLEAFGYIEYDPSYYHRKPSQVYLRKL